jgi:cytochrome bd ubiquinol oxidase subunit II
METLWFVLVSFMLTMYVVLDGFDLGAGIIHLNAAKTDAERRMILNAIGPVWDGNEVWILAAGGTLYFAFPLVYASSLSGFYLPLIMILWLLISRGLGIEFRHQVNNPLWRSFWDVVFSLSSGLLAIFLGAALGNIIRGVPLSQGGYFFEPLWTTFTVVPESGILDWYTIMLGLIAFFTLTMHGSSYIAMKTEGDVQHRSRAAAGKAWWGVLATTVAGVIATFKLRPELSDNFTGNVLGFLFPLAALLGLSGVGYYFRKRQDLRMFLSSSLFILGMLGGTAYALYPNLLISSIDASASLTIHNAAAQPYGLSVGLTWWIVGMVLVLGYFLYVYRSFRGKVIPPIDEAGY